MKTMTDRVRRARNGWDITCYPHGAVSTTGSWYGERGNTFVGAHRRLNRTATVAVQRHFVRPLQRLLPKHGGD